MTGQSYALWLADLREKTDDPEWLRLHADSLWETIVAARHELLTGTPCSHERQPIAMWWCARCCLRVALEGLGCGQFVRGAGDAPEGEEVPFPPDPECLLTWQDDWPPEAVGRITFVDPKDGRRTSIPVTRRPGGYDGDHPTLGNVWEFIVRDSRTIETKPSIHAVGWWHSPNPTRWRLVDRLADEAGDG